MMLPDFLKTETDLEDVISSDVIRNIHSFPQFKHSDSRRIQMTLQKTLS